MNNPLALVSHYLTTFDLKPEAYFERK